MFEPKEHILITGNITRDLLSQTKCLPDEKYLTTKATGHILPCLTSNQWVQWLIQHHMVSWLPMSLIFVGFTAKMAFHFTENKFPKLLSPAIPKLGNSVLMLKPVKGREMEEQ